MNATGRKLLCLIAAAPLIAPLAAFAAGDASLPYSPYADVDYPTDVYFGDTHVHTALSADAAAPHHPDAG